jgi:glycosyltransferase involved in cell wall biosynthesis
MLRGGGDSLVQILFVYSRPASFVEIDLELLRERWEVREWAQPGRYANPATVAKAVRQADLVFGWFASWHTLLPFTFARLFGKPSVLVTGGFDTANMPEIGYGYQRGGATKRFASSIIRSATRLVAASEYARDEVVRNVGVRPEDVSVVYHGVPDPFGELPLGEREAVVLTVGQVGWLTYERKGLRPFVQAARLAPELRFVLVGAWLDDAVDRLRDLGGGNVEYTGRVSDEELTAWYRRSSVYVQASRHEAFGMSVAEAMLGGCLPVVARAGALPEVVGDVGVQLDRGDAEAIAEAARQLVGSGEAERSRARDRVLQRFPVEARREGLYAAVEEALSRGRAGRGRRA